MGIEFLKIMQSASVSNLIRPVLCPQFRALEALLSFLKTLVSGTARGLYVTEFLLASIASRMFKRSGWTLEVCIQMSD